jgi:hypothetical protein
LRPVSEDVVGLEHADELLDEHGLAGLAAMTFGEATARDDRQDSHARPLR